MCLAILKLDSRYSDIRPRRPNGGPDGARDIEARYSTGEVAWGAVGFRSNANDTATDRTWAKNKFKSDLDNAVKANPALRVFVFFTNVDLRPSDNEELESHAKNQGITTLDILWRERLKIALDSPRGLSIRYQFLRIPLSDAEQATFFAEWGTTIEDALQRGIGTLDAKLRRLEFRAITKCR